MRYIAQIIFYCNVFIFLINIHLAAQDAVFLYNGTITFEKKTNVSYFLKEEYQENSVFYNSYKERYPDFSTYNFLLHFNKTETYYKPEIPLQIGLLNFTDRIGGSNEILRNLTTDSFITRKEILGKSFTIEDETRKIKWKITDEVRDIAGLKCHRANAIIFDSIFVIAYYSDQIPVSAGPESLCGLPGMILGLAIPRLHTTWFATKIINKDDGIKAHILEKLNSTESEKSYMSKVEKMLDSKSTDYLRSILQAKL